MVGTDYYLVLGVARESSDEAIKKAYRKQALKWHPEKNESRVEEASQKFREIAEAYDVLSDASRRATYDRYGEPGLKSGAGGTGTGGYQFMADPQAIFARFFGTGNPYESLFNDPAAAGLVSATKAKKSEPVNHVLRVTLEELYSGSARKVKLIKQVLNADGKTTHSQDKVLSITVQPGWAAGTKITFPNEGDQGPSVIPADVIFTLEEAPHARFARRGDDLITTVSVPLLLALSGGKAPVATLDDRELHVPLNDIITPKSQIVVPGEGMPLAAEPGTRGNLIVNFDIVFPRALSTQQKELLAKALGQ